MKGLFSSLALGSILIISIIAAIKGAVLMSINLFFNSDTPFLLGFEYFSLGAILFIVVLSGYMISKIFSSMEVLVESVANLVQFTLDKEKNNSMHPINPIEALFGNLGLPGSGTIKMAKLDEDGTITPFLEKEFNSPDEFIRHRNEILSKALGGSGNKKVEDMSLEELQEEEKKAVIAQNFELAACIRDAINEKTKKKE